MKLGKYKHYKGNFYQVIGVARHEEDPSKEFVVYKALYSSKDFGKNSLWIRPKAVFTSKVVFRGKKIPRFRYVGRL